MYNDSDSDGGNWDDSDDDDFYRRKASAVVEEERTPDVVTFTHTKGEWLNTLKERYIKEASTKVHLLKHDIKACFYDCSCKHQMALYIHENCNNIIIDPKGKVPNLSFFIFSILSLHPDVHVHPKFDSFIYKRAWRVAANSGASTFTNVCSSFKLSVETHPWIVDEVKTMLKDEKYREVFSCIKSLKLKEITIDQIALPLISSGNTNLLETYLSGNKGLQTALMKLLDDILDEDNNIEDFVRCVSNTAVSDLCRKKILKLAIRYIAKYNIDEVFCNNIKKQKAYNSIRFLLHQYYDDNELSIDELNDGLEDISNEIPASHEYIVDKIIDYLDMDLAAYWACKLDLEEIPNQIEDLVDNIRQLDVNKMVSEKQEVSESHWYQFPLPLDKIHWVDESDDYDRCITHISRPNTKVGIDCEWKPTFNVGQVARISIMQLAVDDECVFLLDMIALTQVLNQSQWKRLCNEFFKSRSVLKIGYGLRGDIQIIMESLPFLFNDLTLSHNVANLEQHATSVIEHSQAKIDDGKNSIKMKGLKGAIEYCLGGAHLVETNVECFSSTTSATATTSAITNTSKPLKKTQQMTNWERRPLDVKQAVYAALDANCLLSLYDYLVTYIRNNQLGINLITRDFVCKKQTTKKKVINTGTKNVAKLQDNKGNIPRISTKNIKFIVDNMLQGLGRQLRACGIDTVILGNDEPHDSIAKTATKDNRIILTSGQPYATLKSQVPEGECLDVPTSKAPEQLQLIIAHFNINVTAKDVFSRCQICNSDNFLRISQNEMLAACEKLSKKKDAKYSHPTRDEDEEGSSEMWKRCKSIRVSMDSYGYIASKRLTVNVENIPLAVANMVRDFYTCDRCAKTYWDGAHYQKACDNLIK